MKVTLAASQRSCSKNYDENIKKATELIRLAKKKNADRILLQELLNEIIFARLKTIIAFPLRKNTTILNPRIFQQTC